MEFDKTANELTVMVQAEDMHTMATINVGEQQYDLDEFEGLSEQDIINKLESDLESFRNDIDIEMDTAPEDLAEEILKLLDTDKPRFIVVRKGAREIGSSDLVISRRNVGRRMRNLYGDTEKADIYVVKKITWGQFETEDY